MCVKRFIDSSTIATGGLHPSADHTRFTQQRPWTSQLVGRVALRTEAEDERLRDDVAFQMKHLADSRRPNAC